MSGEDGGKVSVEAEGDTIGSSAGVSREVDGLCAGEEGEKRGVTLEEEATIGEKTDDMLGREAKD